MTPPKPRSRAGYTLIEVAVGLTVTASTLLLTVQMIHRSLSLSSRITQHQNAIRSFGRFAETFRHDVHHAKGLASTAKGRVELSWGDDKRVVYAVTSEHVWRRVFRGEELQQRDALVIPFDLEAVFLVLDDPKRVTIRLQASEPVALSEPVAQSRATAVLGLRRRELPTGGESQ